MPQPLRPQSFEFVEQTGLLLEFQQRNELRADIFPIQRRIALPHDRHLHIPPVERTRGEGLEDDEIFGGSSLMKQTGCWIWVFMKTLFV